MLLPEAKALWNERLQNEMDSICELSHLSAEAVILLFNYSMASVNFYGIILLRDLYTIVQTQVPELSLTEDAFLTFARHMDNKSIDGINHIYLRKTDNDYDRVSPECVNMDCAFISDEFEEALCDEDFDKVFLLREQQQNWPLYIPEKDEFLEYSDSSYYEETPAIQKLRLFLLNAFDFSTIKIKFDGVVDDILIFIRGATEDNPLESIYDVFIVFRWESAHDVLIQRQDEFLKCLEELYYNTRYRFLNGHTLTEIARIAEAEGKEPIQRQDFSDFELFNTIGIRKKLKSIL